jgi:hypothetical protein
MGRIPARSSRSALKMQFDDQPGVLPPTGYWDPLGLSKDIDQETFDSYREAELKHGRVAMLAVIGYLVQESNRLPGTIDLDGTSFSAIPNGIAAIGAVPIWGWIQIIASAGYWELIGWEDRKGEGIGNYKFGDQFPNSENQLEDFRTKELQNGRLAMLAIMELLTHDVARPAGESLLTLHHY